MLSIMLFHSTLRALFSGAFIHVGVVGLMAVVVLVIATLDTGTSDVVGRKVGGMFVAVLVGMRDDDVGV